MDYNSKGALNSFFSRTSIVVNDLLESDEKLNDVFSHNIVSEAFSDLLKSIVGSCDYNKLLWVGLTIVAMPTNEVAGNTNEHDIAKKTIQKSFAYFPCNPSSKNEVDEKWKPLIEDEEELDKHLATRLSVFKLFTEGKLRHYDRLYLYNGDGSFDRWPALLVKDHELREAFLKYQIHLNESEINRFQEYLDFILHKPELAFYCVMPLYHRTFFQQSFGEIYVAATTLIDENKLNQLLLCLEKISLAFAVMLGEKARNDIKSSRENIRKEKEELDGLLRRVNDYTNKIMAQASVIMSKRDDVRNKQLVTKKLAKAELDLYAKSYTEFNDVAYVETVDFDISKMTETSLKHEMMQGSFTYVNEFSDKYNKLLIQNVYDLANRYNPGSYLHQHISELHKYFKARDYGDGNKWWPFVYNPDWHTGSPFLEGYLKEILSEDINIEIHIGNSPIFLPFFAYALAPLFARNGCDDREERTPPNMCTLRIEGSDTQTTMTITWNHAKPDREIDVKSLLDEALEKEDGFGTQKLTGRMIFLSWVFPDVYGSGFELDNGMTKFTLTLNH